MTLWSMDTKTLISLIKKYLIKPNKEMTMFITDGVNKKRYVFDFIKHPINWLVKRHFKPIIMVKNGKSSGRILFEKGKQSIDVGLRMRIHTNNGATAYLSAGGSNSTAMFVMKFQQDGIKKLLNEVDPIVV